MLFPSRCPVCRHENRVEFADASIHDLQCTACGAAYCLFVRKQKFEVLFDLGTRALMDGYAREAVASFAAALERFFEFYIRAFVLEQASGKDEEFDVAVNRLDTTWRHVVSQSERQIGMFALAYLLREGQEPDFLTGKALGADFRNRVIHRGYLPRRAEVDEYAARIFALIDRLLTELGPGAGHVELAQERSFAAHLSQLPEGVTAVFEEHPGMFRARRFASAGPVKSAPVPAGRTQGALNDAQVFARALAERGAALDWLRRF
ncbi:hypothetical protein DEDE109153_10015 [Deinococcus deserti]|uniref:Zn-finger containing protein n=1 Tax=Deinococcus deserti (strain DSM 17065 / CIP 109153 / LMG 22923 / VCD115) TaxID=546414 RepID=C1CZZ5_DEIDV|nr:hypothetical protein [Deinococcus deserti]ACO45247.1 hypothetical protein Deide_04200 [Deinococcus deserti VCD115]